MRPNSSNQKLPAKKPAEAVVKDICRATRRHFSAEDKIRIVLDGLRSRCIMHQSPVEAKACLMDTHDLLPDLVIAPGTRRTQLRIGKARRVIVPGGRGDRQFVADRLDTHFPVMSVYKRHHHFALAVELRLRKICRCFAQYLVGLPQFVLPYGHSLRPPRVREPSGDPGHWRPAPLAPFFGSPPHGTIGAASRRCSQSSPQLRSLRPTPNRNRRGALSPSEPHARGPQAKTCS